MGIRNDFVRLASYEETKKLNPNGRQKMRCPQCGAVSFKPYIFAETGEAIDAQECGYCDHAARCGYNLTPAQYWQKYPERKPNNGMSKEERRQERELRKELERKHRQRQDLKELAKLLSPAGDINATSTLSAETEPEKAPSRIPWELVRRSEERAENTPFFRFLCTHVDADTVRQIFKLYHVGADKLGRSIFWQIDEAGEVRTGKVMEYAENGHRAKLPNGDAKPGAMNWVHSVLKKKGSLPESWQLEQCLFGAHLLRSDDLPQPVCLVEAEKTAIIAACFMPQYTWIATGGKNNLKSATLRPLIKYAKMSGPVTVFADLGSREAWAAKLEPLRLLLPFTLSDLLEKSATAEARARGLDLADYLTGEF